MPLSPESISAFQSLDEGGQRTALGSMSQEAKQALLAGIKAGGEVDKAIAGMPKPQPPNIDLYGDTIDPHPVQTALGGMLQNAFQVGPAGVATSIAQKLAPEWSAKHIPQIAQSNALPVKELPKAATLNFILGGGENVLNMAEAPRPMPRAMAAKPEMPSPPPTAEPTLPPEAQAKYTAALDKANEPYLKYRAAHENYTRQQAIAEDMKQGIGQVHEGIQQLYPERRAALNQGWNALREEIRTPDTPTRSTVDAINTAVEEDLRGSPTQLKQFKDILREVGAEYIDEGSGKITVPENAVADWQTMRTQSSAIGRAMSGDIPGNVKRALGRVQDAVETSLAETARKNGVGREYEALKDTEYQFRKDFEDLGPINQGRGNPAARVVRAPNPEFAEPHITGKAGQILSDTLRRWDPTGRLADAVDRVRKLSDEAKSMTKIKQEPQAPTVKPIERPEAGAQKKLGPLGRAAAWAGGKLVGHAVAGFPGYVVGGKAGPELVERYMNRNNPPPPPPPRP